MAIITVECPSSEVKKLKINCVEIDSKTRKIFIHFCDYTKSEFNLTGDQLSEIILRVALSDWHVINYIVYTWLKKEK